MNVADLKLGTDRNLLVAQVTGDIDMSNANDLGAALTEAISNDLLGAVLDLSALDYLDSAGVQLIYTLRERLRARGQELSLVIADGSQVAAALRLAGATSYVNAVSSVEQAFENLFGHEPAEA